MWDIMTGAVRRADAYVSGASDFILIHFDLCHLLFHVIDLSFEF